MLEGASEGALKIKTEFNVTLKQRYEFSADEALLCYRVLRAFGTGIYGIETVLSTRMRCDTGSRLAHQRGGSLRLQILRGDKDGS